MIISNLSVIWFQNKQLDEANLIVCFLKLQLPNGLNLANLVYPTLLIYRV